MNYHPLAQPVMLSEASSAHFFSSPDSHSNHHFFIDTVLQNRWLIVAITMTITLIGILIAYSVQPIYESSLLIHVEEKGQREPKNILGEAGSMLDLKTPATAEIELLRSRMVIARAIDELGRARHTMKKLYQIILLQVQECHLLPVDLNQSQACQKVE